MEPSSAIFAQDFDYDSHTIREEMEHAWKDVLYYKDKIAEYAKLLEEGNPDKALIERYGKLEERFEFLGGYDYESKTRKILTGLGFKDEDWDPRYPFLLRRAEGTYQPCGGFCPSS